LAVFGAHTHIQLLHQLLVHQLALPAKPRLASPAASAVGHDIDPAARSGVNGHEHAKPIVIGDDVWIGGGAIVM
jgi:acetyltransferase-like isoleucine patch superfamily enzyme